MEGLNASRVTEDDITAITYGVAAVIDGVNASHITGVTVIDASRRRLEGLEQPNKIQDQRQDDQRSASRQVSAPLKQIQPLLSTQYQRWYNN